MSQWQPIETAPKDGTRLRLGHERDPSSMKERALCPTFGSFNGRAWDLSSYFIVPGGQFGLMTNVPTHWLPAPEVSHVG